MKKMLLTLTMVSLLVISFVLAPPLYQHVYNGTEWIPLKVDDYGNVIITPVCVESYYEYECTDNGAPPNTAGGLFTHEATINYVTTGHGKYFLHNITFDSMHISSRTDPICTTYPIYGFYINNLNVANITIISNSNYSTEGFPINATWLDWGIIKTVTPYNCLVAPDDLIIEVVGHVTCD